MMGIASDARFWDRSSRKYAIGAIADQAGYERTLDRTRALLGPGDKVLELGRGTGTTALRLAGDVQNYLATDISAGMIAIANEKHAAGPIPAPIPALVFRTATWSATCLVRCAASTRYLQRKACSSPRHPASAI
jgi:SAM-dependent methyltransferase